MNLRPTNPIDSRNFQRGGSHGGNLRHAAFAWIRRTEALAVAVATLASGAVAATQMRSAVLAANSAVTSSTTAAQSGDLAALNSIASGTVNQSAADSTGSQELPTSISASIPDDATLTSPSVAVTDDGTALDVQTGEQITDPQIVGTEDTPPDPLAATGGTHYTPLSVGEAREQIADDATATASTVADEGTADEGIADEGTADEGTAVAQNASYQGNSWGAYWNGSTIYNHDGSAAITNAKFMVDVSVFQKTIDWAAVKASGVQGAIIRVGYGWDNPMDSTAAYNIQQCKRLGIPFGIYLYSYAANTSEGAAEGHTVVRYLKELGVSASDMSYPIYYDLEKWSWTGHSPSQDPNVNASILRSFVSTLANAGYGNVSVYSYTSYLNTALNSSYIHSLTTWVAQYGAKLQYTAYGSAANGQVYKGWQYHDAGRVSGISGNVDLDAFSHQTYENVAAGTTFRLYNPNTGEHFFTLNGNEQKMLVQLGWYDEGIAWVATTTSKQVPVYRFYNPNTGEHHYTIAVVEKNMLTSVGWKYEGIAWYSDPKQTVPIYRVYNPNAKAYSHLYTVNANEAFMLARAGWNREGIGWYAVGL